MGFSIPKKLRIAVVTALIVTLLAPAGLLLAPKTADAIFVPVGDVPNAPPHWANSIADIWEKIKDAGLDAIAWIAAKMILQQITANVVSWINSGFRGNPAFINDPTGFFLGIADQAAGAFIFNTDFKFLCSPLRPMQIGIHASLLVKYQGQFAANTNRSCRLTDIFNNAQGLMPFLNGNTTVPAAQGWKSWIAITQIPQNNIYGAYAIADVEMQGRVGGAQSINKTVADWGQGFASKFSKPPSCNKDTKLCSGGGLMALPGNTANNLLIKALGTGQDALVAADELAEMVSAVAGALINKLISTGLSSLSQTTGTQSSYASRLHSADPTQFYTNPNPAWTSVNDQVNQQTTQQAQQNIADTDVPAFDTGGGTIPPQDAKIVMGQLPITMACPIQGSTDVAGNAVDNSQTSIAKSKCGNVSPTDLNWFNISFSTQAQRIDQIVIAAAGRGDGPDFAVFTDAAGNSYRVPFTDPAGAVPDQYTSEYDLTLPDNYTNPTAYTITGTRGENIVAVVLDPVTGLGINLRLIPMKNVAFYSPRVQLYLAEIYMYAHLIPEVDTANVPNSLSGITSVTNIYPRPDTWVKGYYYPLHNNRQQIPPYPGQLAIDVVVKDSNNVPVLPFSLDDPNDPVDNLLYRFPITTSSITYSFDYTAVYDGQRSATIRRYITMKP